MNTDDICKELKRMEKSGVYLPRITLFGDYSGNIASQDTRLKSFTTKEGMEKSLKTYAAKQYNVTISGSKFTSTEELKEWLTSYLNGSIIEVNDDN